MATELKPTTPHQFHFWTARDATCGIGTIVRVDDDGRTVSHLRRARGDTRGPRLSTASQCSPVRPYGDSNSYP